MRRRTTTLAGICLLSALSAGSSTRPADAQSGPPHAWLFGTWTGGLFPASTSIGSQACLATPVVIFTRDVVLRATLTDITYTQRVIETARTSANETEFQFTPAASPTPSNPFLGNALAAPQPSGFGCENPNVLHVQRRSDNEIVFPGCAEFPNPLVRCPSR